MNPDQLGTPRTITDSAGTQVWRWDHDAFGNGLPTATGKFTYNLRFAGQYYDAETGLHHNNARDYNPATGRYIQSDPIGLIAGNNTYTYVGGNPVNLSDPSGQCPICVALIVLEVWNIYDTANDVADTANVLNNECSSYDDKLEAVGSLIFGVIDPTPGNLGKKGLKKVAKGTRYGPMNPGPLDDATAATFRSGSYTATTTSETTTLYRVYGGGNAGKLGPYWTRTKPSGPLQSQLDSALAPQWGNTADNVVSIQVPKGTTIFEGAAAPQSTGVGQILGGGNQVYIPRVDAKWIK